jgi:hypothetical protein
MIFFLFLHVQYKWDLFPIIFYPQLVEYMDAELEGQRPDYNVCADYKSFFYSHKKKKEQGQGKVAQRWRLGGLWFKASPSKKLGRLPS